MSKEAVIKFKELLQQAYAENKTHCYDNPSQIARSLEFQIVARRFGVTDKELKRIIKEGYKDEQ